MKVKVDSGGLRPLVELCVEPAGRCGRCTGVAVPLRVPPERSSKVGHGLRIIGFRYPLPQTEVSPYPTSSPGTPDRAQSHLGLLLQISLRLGTQKMEDLMKRVASPGSMHDTGCLGLVHWDDPEGWNGERGGRRVQDGEHTLARDGVSREVPCSALKGETVPDSLPATPKSPPTRRVPPRGPCEKPHTGTAAPEKP